MKQITVTISIETNKGNAEPVIEQNLARAVTEQLAADGYVLINEDVTGEGDTFLTFEEPIGQDGIRA